ncbi:hypothetical protein HYH03_005118 [Edaphochlamys debaryana]|uniref:Uncharacterized protein n=1 Tax=Edaphochlamys debaryana TaxID=47281 RepID=A0A835Y8G6_9CHLO|nr:hypothetical protein HYH03_005118 [Edaphochlamys debaryana]|eukprot:KAG2496703.1 hypothetical protein HYH03_005118 [Edaphochlamys debaryana]
MIASLRRGELPPGGVRLPGFASGGGRSAAATSPAYGGGIAMPPPAQALGGYDTPFGAPGNQPSSLQKMAATKKAKNEPAGGSVTGYVGRRLERLFPDLSPPWVKGTVVQYNAANGQHLIQYGPPLRKELWDNIDHFAPQNFRWLEGAAEPAPIAPKSSTVSKTGGSKSAPKAATPKAPPPPPPVLKQPIAPPPLLPLLPGGPSTFNAVGVTITSPPYNDAFLRTSLAKNRPEELMAMLGAMGDREMAAVREILTLLEDPGDVEAITRLLDQLGSLGQQEQQLRAELRELGIA